MKKPILGHLAVWFCIVLGALGSLAQQKPADDPAVRVIRDVAYYDGKEADAKKHQLDLYLPKEKKDFPVLMFVHGGAWRSGDRALYGALGQTFAKAGFGTACISYRLSPAVKHPAHIEDVARAFAWLHGNIAKQGGDPKRLFIGGHSAGGHLVALLALNEKYLQAHKLSGKDLAGVIPLSGVHRVIGNMFSAFGPELAGWKDASPIEHVRADTPPWLLIYAQHDYPGLGLMARELHAALTEKKNVAEVLEIPDKTHITIITSIASEGDPTTAAMLKFMRAHAK